MVDAIECIVDNVKNIFVGNVTQQISLTIILETNVVYGLVKTKSVMTMQPCKIDSLDWTFSHVQS